MKYSCVDQVLPSPFQKEQEIMKSPNPSQMAGRREGWRTSTRLAWSVATFLLSVDDLSLAFIVKLSPSTPPTQNLSLLSAGAYNGCADRFIQWQHHFDCWYNFLECIDTGGCSLLGATLNVRINSWCYVGCNYRKYLCVVLRLILIADLTI